MLLVDTDVMIDLLRQYPPALTWLDSLGEEEIVLPGSVGKPSRQLAPVTVMLV